MSKVEMLLEEIQRTGGMTFGECQRFLVELKYGPGAYDTWKNTTNVWVKNSPKTRVRKYRGHYSGYLCGCKNYDMRRRPAEMGPGSVLDKWCDRDPKTRKYSIKPGLVLAPPYFPKEWPKR